jgi:uncharacterized protein (DUF1015 family)
MADIIPFRAVRPAPDKVHLVATRSYVSYSRPNLKRKLAENPFSFIHVINPEYSMGLRPVKGQERFKLVKKKYQEFVNKGILVQESQPVYYIYRQIQPGNSFTGIICGVSIDDYLNGTIKIHEQTITRRERLFKQYLDICNFNAEPVLLTYPDDGLIDAVVDQVTSTRPVYDFSTTDLIRHQLWTIVSEKDIQAISERFATKNSIYIADGHPRSASSSLLGQERRRCNPAHTGSEMYNYLMACMIPESQLSIYDFNRVVKDLNGLSENDFLERLTVDFDITPQSGIFQPERLHEISMYLNGKWFALRLKYEPVDVRNAGHLDAHILSEKILFPHLNIRDLKTDARIEFVSGKVGMDGLELYARKKKMALAFGLFPVTTMQLKAVADAGEIMPPKTTWIEPKLRSGLTILSFDH